MHIVGCLQFFLSEILYSPLEVFTCLRDENHTFKHTEKIKFNAVNQKPVILLL